MIATDLIRSGRTALQIGDKYRVTTPVNWKKGDDVIVHPTVSNEEAKTLFPDFTVHKVSGSIFISSLSAVIHARYSPTSGPRLLRSTRTGYILSM